MQIRNARVLVLVVGSLLSVVCHSSAQDGATDHKHQDLEQQGPGLAEDISAFVRRMHQDRRGHFWFGTNGDGVCRFDGKTVTYFTPKNGFNGSAVRGIVEDAKGHLWFGTNFGVTHFDGETFTNFTADDGLPHQDVWTVFLDRAGTLWVGTYGGACRFDHATKRFTAFAIPPGTTPDPMRGVHSPDIVHAIAQDRTGRLWFACSNVGVYTYDGTHLVNISAEHGLCGNSVNDILQDHRGDLWFATHYHGICRYDGATFVNVSETEGLKGIEAWDLFQDSAGNLWITVEHAGVYRYDGTTFKQFSTTEGLANNAVQCTFEDREGRIWCGGYQGAFRLDGASFTRMTIEQLWR